MSEETKVTRKKRSEKPKAEKEKILTPQEYFEYVKSKKNIMTEEELINIYDNACQLIKKYMITGQSKPIMKLKFFLETIEAEFKVVKAGYNHYVYRWDLEDYVENISDKSVRIVELMNYEREIPDEIIDEISKAKEIFNDKLYILFTDYTGKEQRKVAKERREKDPILFGALEKDDAVLDRLYYICDWIDPACDLTLEQLAKDYNKLHKKDGRVLVKSLDNPTDLESLKRSLGLYGEEKKSPSGYVNLSTDFSGELRSNTIAVNTSTSNI